MLTEKEGSLAQVRSLCSGTTLFRSGPRTVNYNFDHPSARSFRGSLRL